MRDVAPRPALIVAHSDTLEDRLAAAQITATHLLDAWLRQALRSAA